MCPPANAAPANATAAKAAISLILFMVWFLSSFGVRLCVSSNRSSDQSADEPAKERGSDLAPVLRVERAAVMAVVVAVIVVMPRLMMLRVRRGRRRVTRDLVPGRGMHRRGMRHCGCPSRCLRSLRRMLGRSRSLCGVRNRRMSLGRWRLLCRRLHRRRGLALRRRVPLRSSHRRATESAAHRERHNHLLYCLVHCRIPFVVRASPFSRLQKDRTIRRNFLTKDFGTAIRKRQAPVLV